MVNRKDSILKAAMKGVRLYGLDGVRIQHIGALAGTSTGNIYAYFQSKDKLMLACFDWVDRQIARIFDRVKADPAGLDSDPVGEVRKLWTAYFRWLVAHPDETVFYHRYRDSNGFLEFERGRDFSYFDSFRQTIQLFQSKFRLYERVEPQVFWAYLLKGTVLLARDVAQGELPAGPETEESIFQLVMNGLRGPMGLG